MGRTQVFFCINMRDAALVPGVMIGKITRMFNRHCSPLRIFAGSLFAFVALGTTGFAEDTLVTFGSSSSLAGKAVHMGPGASKSEMTETAEALVVKEPDPWSMNMQIKDVTGVSLESVGQDDYFTLTIKGRAQGEGQVVRVQFVATGWQTWAMYEFDISGISQDEFTTVKALTPVKQPFKSQGTLPFTTVEALQLFTWGKMPATWELEFKSIGFEKSK